MGKKHGKTHQFVAQRSTWRPQQLSLRQSWIKPRVAWVAVAMFHWIYDVAWTSLLTLRQGPKEDLGAQEMPVVGGGAGEWLVWLVWLVDDLRGKCGAVFQ